MKIESVTAWDVHYMGLAQLWALRSKDPSTKVGAVIVNERGRVVSQGYNGLPEGFDDAQLLNHDREWKMRRVIHAEMNVVLNSVAPIRGGRLYITPLPPCSGCAAILRQAGITEVNAGPVPVPDRWVADMVAAAEVLFEGGVKLRLRPNHRSWNWLVPESLDELNAIIGDPSHG